MTSHICGSCGTSITSIEWNSNNKVCNECKINRLCYNLAFHLREAHITFEEMIRKLISEVDK